MEEIEVQQKEQRRILVVGMGEVGSALAAVIERRTKVWRLDLEPRDYPAPVDVMHICIPFQSPAQFEDAVTGYMQRFLPRLTIINSTVQPGTTRSIATSTRAPVAYSPVRGKHARMTDELLNYVKYVAAPDQAVAGRAINHFRTVGMKPRMMSRPETLELAKLAETTYFGVLIAFAQELDRYAKRTGAEYEEAIEFFEEVEFLPRTHYFPGFIGGHCVIPNIHLLLQTRDSGLLKAVLDSNALRSQNDQPVPDSNVLSAPQDQSVTDSNALRSEQDQAVPDSNALRPRRDQSDNLDHAKRMAPRARDGTRTSPDRS